MRVQESAPPFTVGKLEAMVGFAIRTLHQHLSAGLTDVLAPMGLRPHQFTALSLIVDNPSMSQGELARALDIKPSNIVPLIDEMETRGLVRREQGAINRRSYALEATQEGRKARDRTCKAIMAYEDSVLAPLSSAERNMLLDITRKLGLP